LRWLITVAAVWVGHELVLATWELDIVVIVKSQGETDVLLAAALAALQARFNL
jgi:hypothetical protein